MADLGSSEGSKEEMKLIKKYEEKMSKKPESVLLDPNERVVAWGCGSEFYWEKYPYDRDEELYRLEYYPRIYLTNRRLILESGDWHHEIPLENIVGVELLEGSVLFDALKGS